MQDNSLKLKAFKLKGRLYTLTVLQLITTDKELFEQQLDDMIAQAPRLFDGTPIVLDCSQLHDLELDLQAFVDQLRRRNILPVAIQGANALLTSLAQCSGLGILRASSVLDKTIENIEHEVVKQPVKKSTTHRSVGTIKSKIQTTPVRSGQQLVATHGDIVVTSTVSRGSELLAEGNIHVYGALRGRALAGISGDKQARIFCMSLDAELLSIAGCYRLSDSIERKQGPCQIFLQDDRIVIEDL